MFEKLLNLVASKTPKGTRTGAKVAIVGERIERFEVERLRIGGPPGSNTIAC